MQIWVFGYATIHFNVVAVLEAIFQVPLLMGMVDLVLVDCEFYAVVVHTTLLYNSVFRSITNHASCC